MVTKSRIHEVDAISVGRPVEKVSHRAEDMSLIGNGFSSAIDRVMGRGGEDRLKVSRAVTTQSSRNALMVSLLESQEEERKRISRELHDGLGQLLTNLKLQMQQCLAGVEASGNTALLGDTWKSMESLPGLVSEAIQEVRTVCRAIRPAILDDLGVLAAITSQCRRIIQSSAGLQIETDYAVTEAEIPDATKTAIYRIVQEALTNCIKYADADLIHVSMTKSHNFLILNIKDNGKGFNVKNRPRNGLGLINMRERAESLQGGFSIESAPLRGTEVQVSIPVNWQLHS